MSQADIPQSEVDSVKPIKFYHWYVVVLLTFISAIQYLDRQVLAIVIEPLKSEFHLSDTELGFLVGTVFAIATAVAGIPLGILADRVSCRKLLASVLVIWSSLTIICSMATSYLHLILIRIGVGAAEAPTKPAAVSLISDLVPTNNRSSAIGLFWTGSSLGTVIAFVFGSYIAAHFGWRIALVIAGLPGLLLAALLILTVKDPARRGADDKIITGESKATPILTTFKFILSQYSLLLMWTGAILTWAVAAGINVWMISFLVRIHDLNLQQAGLLFGIAHGGTSWLGSILGGWIADFVAKRNIMWVTKVSGFASLLAGLCAIGMLLTGSLPLLIIFCVLWSVAQTANVVPIIAFSQSLVGPRMRATAMAIFLTVSMLVAQGLLGPQLIGVLSDFFTRWWQEESIRYGILAMTLLNFIAIGIYLLSNIWLKRDLAKAANA